jgi:hypothetical protein
MTAYSPELLSLVASFPFGVEGALDDVLDGDHPSLEGEVREHLGSMSVDAVSATVNDPRFVWMYTTLSPLDREERARRQLLSTSISALISSNRLAYLSGSLGLDDLGLATTAGLTRLPTNEEGLTPLSQFKFAGGYLLGGEYIYTIATPIPSPNAMYWFTLNLSHLPSLDGVAVRVDPYLWGHRDTYLPAGYKMLVYGRPLDWARIGSLRQPEHGEWRRGGLSDPSILKTDYVWTPRGDEVHFACEELPTAETRGERGTRYVHAVYDRARAELVHFDCATRVLSTAEWGDRTRVHLRHTGKIGSRAKVFRLDGQLAPDLFSQLCATYFVWNYDVAGHLGDEASSGLAG